MAALKFTTLDLSTQLEAIYNKNTHIPGLEANAQRVQIAIVLKSCRDEIDRQMKIYTDEEQAFVDAVKKNTTDIKRLHDAAVKDLAELEKLKHDPKNAHKIKELHKRIDQASIGCAARLAPLQQAAIDMAAHTDFRNNPVPKELAIILGSGQDVALYEYFKKARAPFIPQINAANKIIAVAHQTQKRMRLMVKEAAVFASDATDTAKVSEMIDAQLDKLFVPNKGPIDFFNKSIEKKDEKIMEQHKAASEIVKGKVKMSRKLLDSAIFSYEKVVDNFQGLISTGRAFEATAKARVDAVLKLAKKAPLGPEQTQRLGEAQAALKSAAKDLSAMEKALAKLKPLVEKDLPKVKPVG